MRTFAYCSAEFKRSVRRAAGVDPLLSPPVTADNFNPAWLGGQDFLYFKLHGFDFLTDWYADDEALICALRPAQVREADLNGAVVFVANCYSSDEHPMIRALLAAGAAAVVGGEGQNYAKRDKVHGADLLGLYLRYALADYDGMVRQAKRRLAMKWPTKANLDALRFKVWRVRADEKGRISRA